MRWDKRSILRSSCLFAFALSVILIFLCGAASAADYLYVSTDGTGVNVVNPTSDAVEATIGGFSHSGLTAVSPDGKVLFVTDDQSIKVINTSSNTIVKSIPFVNANVIGEMVASGDSRLYITNHTRYVYIYDGTTGNYIDRIDSGANVFTLHLALSPDYQRLYVSQVQHPDRYNISAYNTQTMALVMKRPVDNDIISLNTAGDRIYAGIFNDQKYYMNAYRASDLLLLKNISLPVSLRYVVVKPDGSMIYAASYYDSKITAIKGDLSSIDQTVSLFKPPSCAAISPDGKRVYMFCMEYIATLNTNNYSLDYFGTTYNVKNIEVVPKGFKFSGGVPTLIIPLITVSPTPVPPPVPTLTVSPPSPDPTSGIESSPAPSPIFTATPVTTPLISIEPLQNTPTANPIRPSPGFETLMAALCLLGTAFIGRKIWEK